MRIGKIFNIPIILHWSLLIGVGFFAFNLIRAGAPFIPDGLDTAQRGILAVAIASSLFASVLVHELAHSVVAKRLGYAVVDITLMLFGGVSMISGDTRRAVHEFYISVVGPVSSLGISALAFLVLYAGTFSGNELITGWLIYLTVVNAFLAAFNMLPGLPLDGGRVARSAIWTLTGDRNRATRYTARSGQAVAVLMIVGAIALMVWQQSMTSGIWTILIAGFLFFAASVELRSVEKKDDEYDGWEVDDAMTPVMAVLPIDMTVSDALRMDLRVYPYYEIPVISSTAMEGFVTLAELRNHGETWVSTGQPITVRDVYRKCRTDIVGHNERLSAAASKLAKGNDALAVFRDNKLVGTIGPTELQRFNSAGFSVHYEG